MQIKKMLGALAVAAVMVAGGATTAFAQATSTATTTPGAPDTGAGGNAATVLTVLGLSALIAFGGGLYLRRSLAER